ncbi:MAG: efflux RND transporter periplasmic adaptor subunit [Bacteroidales bacterium]|nr:efflux RND transporter periplasmic adaptor subunit [Bacteroidales bacterium]
MKKTIIITLSVVALAIIGLVVFGKLTATEDLTQLEVEAGSGKFEVLVSVTGELQAESSQEITGPTELRTSRGHRFSQIKIQDLIPEGTVVDSGDYVALLDRSDVTNRVKDLEDELEKKETALMTTRLDTTMQLRNLRDELVNLNYNMEEAEITLDQSRYESPAVIRQAQISLDKSERAYEQAKKNYKLRIRQAQADMRNAEINLSKDRRSYEDMTKIISKFQIHAPSGGMVIYKKEWGGQKRKVGSMISPWDLTVATLPDLSSMISKTYVNEIDVSKLEPGQKVRIGVDAFPEKKYEGRVFEVANIGEQLPNTDAKVFEVSIKIEGNDPILRPAMTTSNQIITSTFEDVVFIPLETIHVEDSIPIVYLKNGSKQVVILGESNENEVIVEQGLNPGEKVLLSLPDELEKYKLIGEDLIPIIKEREKQKKLEEERMKNEALKASLEKGNMQFRGKPGENFKMKAGNGKPPEGVKVQVTKEVTK